MKKFSLSSHFSLLRPISGDHLVSLGGIVAFFFLVFLTWYVGRSFFDIIHINSFSLLWQGHWWQPEHFGWNDPELIFMFHLALWVIMTVLLFYWLRYMFSAFVAGITCLLLVSAAFRFEWLLDNYYRLILFNMIWGLATNILLIWYLVKKDKSKYFYLAGLLFSAILFFFSTPVHMLLVVTLIVTIVRLRFYKPQRVLPMVLIVMGCAVSMFIINDYMGMPGRFQLAGLGHFFSYLFAELQVALGWNYSKFFSLSFHGWNVVSILGLIAGILVLIKFYRSFPRFFLLLLVIIGSLVADLLFNAYLYISFDGWNYLKSSNLFIHITFFLFLALGAEALSERFERFFSIEKIFCGIGILGILVYWQFSAMSLFSSPLHYIMQTGQNLHFQVPKINTLLIQELHGARRSEMDYARRILKERSPVDYYFYLIGHYISQDERADLLHLYETLKEEEIEDELLLMIAAYFITVEEYEVVEEILAPYSQQEEPPSEYYFFQAQLFVQKAQYNYLVDFLEEHEDYIPEEDLYYFNGLLYFMQGDFELARESFENIPHTLRRFPYASFLMGRIFYYQQQYAQALTYFQMAYEGNFTSSALYLDYINCLLATHQFERAREKLEEALTLFHGDERFLMLAGKIYLNLGKYYWYRFEEPYTREYFLKKAHNFLTELITQKPDAAYPHYLYANSALLLENWENAEWGIERALEIQPHNRRYLLLELEISLKKDDEEKAKELRRDLFIEHTLTDEEIQRYIPTYPRFREEMGLPQW